MMYVAMFFTLRFKLIQSQLKITQCFWITLALIMYAFKAKSECGFILTVLVLALFCTYPGQLMEEEKFGHLCDVAIA